MHGKKEKKKKMMIMIIKKAKRGKERVRARKNEEAPPPKKSMNEHLQTFFYGRNDGMMRYTLFFVVNRRKVVQSIATWKTSGTI